MVPFYLVCGWTELLNDITREVDGRMGECLDTVGGRLCWLASLIFLPPFFLPVEAVFERF